VPKRRGDPLYFAWRNKQVKINKSGDKIYYYIALFSFKWNAWWEIKMMEDNNLVACVPSVPLKPVIG